MRPLFRVFQWMRFFFPYILKINFSHSWASNLEICVFKLGWTKLKVKMQTLKGKKRGTIGELTSRSEFFSITIIFTRCFSLQILLKRNFSQAENSVRNLYKYMLRDVQSSRKFCFTCLRYAVFSIVFSFEFNTSSVLRFFFSLLV